MMIAALAIVWHGALSSIAHPIGLADGHVHESAMGHAGHDGLQLALTQQDDAAVSNRHHHDHGPSKSKNECCSTVSAVMVPVPFNYSTNLDPRGRNLRPASQSGQGVTPPALQEPPSTTYQC